MGMVFRPTPFGLMLEYPVPEGCDLVIVCLDRSIGHVPVRFLLPHQVYREDLQHLLAGNPGATGVTLIPCRSGEKITVPPEVIGRLGVRP